MCTLLKTVSVGPPSTRPFASVFLFLFVAFFCACPANETGQPTPTLERLIEATPRLRFEAPRQLSGQRLLALSCAGADANDGLIVTVCQYPTHAAATRGNTEASAIVDRVPHAGSVVRGKSVLFFVARSATPEEHVTLLVDTFATL